MNTLTMKSQTIVKQKEFEWKWRIENFNIKQKYVRLFSLDDDRLVLQVVMKPITKKDRTAKLQWRFMKISKLWSEKKFNLCVVSEPDYKFNCSNGRFEDMLLNQMFSGSSFPLKWGNYRSCLDKTKALNLKFEMTLRDDGKPKANKKFELNDEIQLNECKKMLYSKQYFDFEFIIGEEKLAAHKAILSSRSEVFEEIFSSGNKEKEKEVATITDIPMDVLKAFLIYIYSEKMPENPMQHIADFLYLGDKFGIPDLMQKCEEILEEHINDSTSILAFKLAHRYKLDEDLMVDSFKFIQKKFSKLNQKLADDFMDDPEAVITLCHDYQKLLEGLKKRVKFNDDVIEHETVYV